MGQERLSKRIVHGGEAEVRKVRRHKAMVARARSSFGKNGIKNWRCLAERSEGKEWRKRCARVCV